MEGDAAEVLLPCAICTRTFMPRSLEKHAKICERAAAKKRKPFDSAKQRIQGTDLAEFLPRQEKKRYSNDEKHKSSWKETHDDFLRTIRAARSETGNIIIDQRQSGSHVSSGAPMRANEKGTCPTCNRQFGVKAYDRHVAWCKERSTRLPISPATKNVAKERLEARMKYRAPTLKNRRQNNRDKYSQSCTAGKTPNRVRETLSVPDNTREKIKENITDSQKPIVTGRGDQSNNRDTYNLGDSREATKRTIVRQTSSLRSIVPELRTMNPSLEISLKHKREPETKTFQTDPVQYTTKSERIQRGTIQTRRLDGKMIDDYYDGSFNISPIDRNEKKNRTLTLSGRSVKVDRIMITARNQGNSKVNDVAVNDNIVEMIVQPCNIYNDDNGELITWEGMKMNRGDFNRPNSKDNVAGENSSENCRRLTRSYFQSGNKFSDKNKIAREITRVENVFVQRDNNNRCFENDRTENVTWSNSIQRLNRTYLIKDSDDHEIVNKDISRDSNRSNDSIDINDNEIVGSISAREDHCENDREKIEIDYEIQSDHESTSNCSLPEATSEFYAVEKCDKIQENFNDDDNNNNKSEEAFYINSVGENRMIDDIVPLSSSSDTETVVNQANDSSENIMINGNIITLVQEKREEENNSSFIDSTDKNVSSHSRGSIVPTDIKSKEPHNAYESSTNKELDYVSEQEEEQEEEDEVEEEEEEEEEEERDMEKNVDDKESKMIDRKDRENDPRRFSSINSKTHRIRSIKINSKIQENLNLLRGSTDTLISSVEAIDYVNNKRSNRVDSIYEEDNVDRSYRIEDRYDKYELLPEIKRDISMEKNSQIFDQNYYWRRTLKFSNDRSINDLMSRNYRQNRLHKRNPKIRILPPILIDSSSPRIQRTSNSSNRPLWSNYMRRRPDFNLVLRCRIGACKEYDPFLIAERQMQDLLSDSSDLSLTEIPSSSSTTKSLLPLSHSSAFIKYPYQTKANHSEKSITNEFDELASDFSSDSTETNSLSREIFLKDFHDSKKNDRTKKISNRELGRRMIIDKSLALGNEIDQDKSNGIDKQYKSDIFNKGISKSIPNRSQTIRAFSAPKSIYQRKSKTPNVKDNNNQGANYNDNNVKNDYLTLSSSELSLSSIVSSDIDLKRSNSVFDQLITSFDDDIVGNDSFPSLRSLLRNESLRTSSNGPPLVPDNNRQFDGHISDEEFSSTDTYKQQEHKINADSAYSSLNRKYSNHGRSGNNDTTNRMEDNVSRNNRREGQPSNSKTKCRMSRFCHECGSRFPETAKFCCQCGIKRLAL